MNRVVEFLNNIPATVTEIIGANPRRRRRFEKNLQKAAKNPELIEWEQWYYNISPVPLKRPPKTNFTKAEDTLAAYHILAFLHDTIPKTAPAIRFFEYNTGDLFEEWVFHIQDAIESISDEDIYSTNKIHYFEVMSRLQQAISTVKADLEGKESEETEQKTTVAKKEKGNVNVNIFGDVQAGKLQIAQDASIHEQSVIKEKKKGILGRIPRWIYYILGTLAALLTILHLLGWLEPIRHLFTR